MAEYVVRWSGYGSTAIAFITGPGVDALRLDTGDNIDTEAIAAALSAAFEAGRAEAGQHQPRDRCARCGRRWPASVSPEQPLCSDCRRFEGADLDG